MTPSFKEYLTEASKHWYAFTDLPRVNNDLVKFLLFVKSNLSKDEVDYVYLDDKYPYKAPTKKKLQIKITSNEVLTKIVSLALKKGQTTEKTKNGFIIKPLNIELYFSGGIRGTGALLRHGVKASIPTNDEQESATIYYITSKIKHKNPTLKEINKAIGFEFDEVWLHSFEEQYKAINGFFGGKLDGYKIYLDSNKSLPHNIIIETAKRLGMNDSKDNWNPSDIWIMKISKSQIKKETENMVSLAQFNSWLEEKFDSREIVGVSLKKIKYKSSANVAVINNRELPKVNLHVSRVLFDPQQTNFILETTGSVQGFNIRVGYKSSSDSPSIYLEGRMKGSNVQLGAVSAKIVQSVFKESGIDIIEAKTKLNPIKCDKMLNELKQWLPVVYKGKLKSFNELEGLAQYRAMYLTYFLNAFMKVKDINETLETFYYSSLKQNKFSSIHLKVY